MSLLELLEWLDRKVFGEKEKEKTVTVEYGKDARKAFERMKEQRPKDFEQWKLIGLKKFGRRMCNVYSVPESAYRQTIRFFNKESVV